MSVPATTRAPIEQRLAAAAVATAQAAWLEIDVDALASTALDPPGGRRRGRLPWLAVMHMVTAAGARAFVDALPAGCAWRR
jgi:hypothetical protein